MRSRKRDALSAPRTNSSARISQAKTRSAWTKGDWRRRICGYCWSLFGGCRKNRFCDRRKELRKPVRVAAWWRVSSRELRRTIFKDGERRPEAACRKRKGRRAWNRDRGDERPRRGLVANYADVLQIGARNMQNFVLLKALGKCGRPILLKRGLSSTVKEL